jgi:hypothetical protein
MKKIIAIIAIALIGLPLHSTADEFDAELFAHSYFSAWTATQKPDATEKELEHYLGFLAEDVGHQHLPYDIDDSRSPEEPITSMNYNSLEVLEIEHGKVSMIRKYN